MKPSRLVVLMAALTLAGCWKAEEPEPVAPTRTPSAPQPAPVPPPPTPQPYVVIDDVPAEAALEPPEPQPRAKLTKAAAQFSRSKSRMEFVVEFETLEVLNRSVHESLVCQLRSNGVVVDAGRFDILRYGRAGVVPFLRGLSETRRADPRLGYAFRVVYVNTEEELRVPYTDWIPMQVVVVP